MRDEMRGRSQDMSGGTVVALEPDDARVASLRKSGALNSAWGTPTAHRARLLEILTAAS